MINCAVNPQAARERVTAYEPILKAKKVMIVGGGVAQRKDLRRRTGGHDHRIVSAVQRLLRRHLMVQLYRHVVAGTARSESHDRGGA